MERVLTSALLLLFLMLPAEAAVYKWTDENGGVHFSDKPHPGAERLDVDQPPVYSPPPVDSQLIRQKTASVASGYIHFGIVQPEPEATVRNNPGTVIVGFKIEPALRASDHIQVLLDGQPVDTGASSATPIELHQVYRGTHTLGAVIKDETGAVVARADPITFYMHRPSVNIPANKPPR